LNYRKLTADVSYYQHFRKHSTDMTTGRLARYHAVQRGSRSHGPLFGRQCSFSANLQG
jgi:hypothetical protein